MFVALLAQADNCETSATNVDASLTIVRHAPGNNASAPEQRLHREIACEHMVSELAARLPLKFLARDDLPGPIEDAPLWTHKSHDPRCWRAVFDGVFSQKETAALNLALEPLIDQWHKTAGPLVTEAVYAQLLGADADLLSAATAKVYGHLIDLGARGLGGSFITLRSVRVAMGEESEEHEVPSEEHKDLGETRRRRFADGQLALHDLSRLEAQPHVDNMWMPSVSWTVLLYLTEEVAGGETLIVDTASSEGVIEAGVLVMPLRGRVLSYTSGPENVHTGAGTLGGNRRILQWWVTGVAL